MKNNTPDALSRNVRLLMLERGITFADFDKRKIGITGMHVRRVISKERMLGIDRLDVLAEFLGVTPSDLIDPHMEIESVTNGNLQELISAFKAASPEGQEFISRFAQREKKT